MSIGLAESHPVNLNFQDQISQTFLSRRMNLAGGLTATALLLSGCGVAAEETPIRESLPSPTATATASPSPQPTTEAPQAAPDLERPHFGVDGDHVLVMEQLLDKIGCDMGLINGKFREIDDRELKRFQRSKDLEDDGWYGPASKSALVASGAIPETNCGWNDRPESVVSASSTENSTAITYKFGKLVLTCEGKIGPYAPGTRCGDDTYVADSTLPIGCPGSNLQGPVALPIVCPPRPDRSECTVTVSQESCVGIKNT